MGHPVFIGLSIIFLAATFVVWRRGRLAARAEFIRSYRFPPGLYEKLRKKRPQLALKDCQLVGNALRQFFLCHLQSGRQFVSMPSQLTDDLWHELILYTRNYDAFCGKAFGQFMHHTPAVVLGQSQRDNSGLRRTWWHACKQENIDPRHATRLPLLFAIDAKLGIADGFRYSPQCESLREGGNGDIYCGADFGDSGFDGSTEGFGDSHSDAGGDGSSFFGGDSGGDGCGGGGCGGGD
ncbi:MAG TPA: hypothetical protein VL381_08525 [Rhodocyclaceae bacterium]|nr:hypothetical protein [Rhodocyclaceae bacterium]